MSIRQVLLDTLDGNKIHIAEKQLQDTDPMILVQGMVELMADHDPQVQHLVLVHLRRVLDDLNTNATEAMEASINQAVDHTKTAIFGLIQSAQLPKALGKPIAELISVITICSISLRGPADNTLVSEVMSFIQSALADGTPATIQEIALKDMIRLSYWVNVHFAGAMGTKWHPFLLDALARALASPDIDVRVAASQATYRMLEAIEDESSDPFADLIPLIATNLGSLIGAGDETRARDVLNHLVELSNIKPIIFKRMATDVASMVHQIINTPDLAQEIKNGAVELAVALCKSAPKMMRDIPGFIDAFFPTLLTFLTELDTDLNDWLTTDNPNDTDEGYEQGTPVEMGETALDDMTIALGGATMLPLISSVIPSFINHEDWRYRHAGILAIGITAEGVQRVITPDQVRDLLALVMSRATDPHPRVRWAVMNSLGHMANDLCDIIHAAHARDVLGAFMAGINDEVDRVKCHATAAVSNFCLDAEPETIEPFLDDIMALLAGQLQTSNRLILKQALSTLGDVAVAAEQQFSRFYDKFMPGLIGILRTACTPADAPIRASAIQSITFIGLTVGNDRFYSDAEQVMAILRDHISGGLLNATVGGDDVIQYFHSAFSGLAKVLKGSFAPFIPVVFPLLIECAKQDASLRDTMPEGVDPDAVDTYDIGDEKKLYVRSAVIDEINSAMYALTSITRQCPEGIMTYVQTMYEIMTRSLAYYHADGCRAQAPILGAAIIGALKPACVASTSAAVELVTQIIDDLVTNYQDESTSDVVQAYVRAFSRIVKHAGDLSTVQGRLAEFLDLGFEADMFVDLTMASMAEGQANELFDAGDKDADDAQYREEIEHTVTEVAAYRAELIKVYGDACLAQIVPHGPEGNEIPYVEALLPVTQQWLEHEWAALRAAGLIIADAVAQFCPAHAGPFVSMAAPVALAALQTRDTAVVLRQLAFSLIAHITPGAARDLAPHTETMMGAAHVQLTAPGSRSGSEAVVSDNALTMLHAMATTPDLGLAPGLSEELLSFWVAQMPPTNDALEVRANFGFLADLMEANNATVIGQDGANLAAIFSMMLRVYGTSQLKDDALNVRLRGLIVAIRESARGAADAAMAGLATDGGVWQKKLDMLLSESV